MEPVGCLPLLATGDSESTKYWDVELKDVRLIRESSCEAKDLPSEFFPYCGHQDSLCMLWQLLFLELKTTVHIVPLWAAFCICIKSSWGINDPSLPARTFCSCCSQEYYSWEVFWGAQTGPLDLIFLPLIWKYAWKCELYKDLMVSERSSKLASKNISWN